MIFRLTSIALACIFLLLATQAEAKNCRKGISCGNTCIAAWKTCHVGSSSMHEPPVNITGSPNKTDAAELNAHDPTVLSNGGLGSMGTGYNKQQAFIQEKSTSRNRMSEEFYRDKFCAEWGGKPEVSLDDKTRVDCVTADLAIEFDFAEKWAESIGQSLHYGRKTNKTPTIALIMESEKDQKYLNHIIQMKRAYGLPIRIFKIYNK